MSGLESASAPRCSRPPPRANAPASGTFPAGPTHARDKADRDSPGKVEGSLLPAPGERCRLDSVEHGTIGETRSRDLRQQAPVLPPVEYVQAVVARIRRTIPNVVGIPRRRMGVNQKVLNLNDQVPPIVVARRRLVPTLSGSVPCGPGYQRRCPPTRVQWKQCCARQGVLRTSGRSPARCRQVPARPDFVSCLVAATAPGRRPVVTSDSTHSRGR